MDLGARIGWGIAIYAIAFLAWSGMRLYGWTGGVAPYLLELLILAFICLWAGSELRFRAWADILSYSAGWAVIAAALDSLYVVPVQGWIWYETASAWSFYLLVALLPLFAVYIRRSASPRHRPWES